MKWGRYLLIGLAVLLTTLACNAGASLGQITAEPPATSSSKATTVAEQDDVTVQPEAMEVQTEATEPAGQEEPLDTETPGTSESQGGAPAQSSECISGVQYQAGSFGDEATWAAYQARIDQNVSTLNAFWASAYPQMASGAFPGVCNVVEYDPQTVPYLAECGLDEQTATQNAFYCSTVNAVMWDGPNFYHAIYQELGDAAVTFITAHEFGHSAQYLSGQVPRRSVNMELQADCFAGAYLQYVNSQGLMSEGDAEEVIAIVFAVGQSRVGTRWLERTHGTPAQREIAVRRGFTEGVAGCQTDFTELTGASR